MDVRASMYILHKCESLWEFACMCVLEANMGSSTKTLQS